MLREQELPLSGELNFEPWGKKLAREGNIISERRLSLRERARAFAEPTREAGAPPTFPGDVMNPPAIDWQAALAQHDRWLRTVALARVREPQAVDEVMQEVALAAVKQSAPLADAGKVAPWLYRLAVLQALLYRRKCGRRRRLNDRYGEQVRNGDGEVSAPPDPLGWLIAEERRALIRRALGQIARRDAEILLLKYTEGWSYHQMAAHLGISHAAVEARLHRARGRLREELAALDVIEAA